MEAFDFDTPIDRHGTHSLKWEVAEGELPMWVADMDFAAAPCIRRAIERRAAHGIYGYNELPPEWAEAYIGWWQRRHGFTMQREWLVFCTGVVPALSSAVRKLTTPGEKVLVQTPVYSVFFNSIVNNGRIPQEVPLRYEAGQYGIDWAALEAGLADPQVSLMILCNPHNPCGLLWNRDELVRIGELCARHGVIVVSDEIHGDLTPVGLTYTPFASVSDTCRRISVSCIAPTKCFNIAGLQTAAVCVPDPVLRHRMWRQLNTDECGEPGTFAIDAAIAAFNEGASWLDALRAYLDANRREALDFLAAELPRLHPVASRATYLLWLDAAAYGLSSGELAAHIRRRTGLYLSAGEPFRAPQDTFLRLNLACPRATLRDGLCRLKRALDELG